MPESMPESVWRVIEISAEQTHDLRRVVLRAEMASKVVTFAEDDWPGAVHLAVANNGDTDTHPELGVVSVSSWIPRDRQNRPGVAAVQLRGMATLQTHQGLGLGGLLLEAGCVRAASTGASLVWANARDAALEFYLRHGFVVDSDGFIESVTGLPHHIIVRDLST